MWLLYRIVKNCAALKSFTASPAFVWPSCCVTRRTEYCARPFVSTFCMPSTCWLYVLMVPNTARWLGALRQELVSSSCRIRLCQINECSGVDYLPGTHARCIFCRFQILLLHGLMLRRGRPNINFAPGCVPSWRIYIYIKFSGRQRGLEKKRDRGPWWMWFRDRLSCAQSSSSSRWLSVIFHIIYFDSFTMSSVWTIYIYYSNNDYAGTCAQLDPMWLIHSPGTKSISAHPTFCMQLLLYPLSVYFHLSFFIRRNEKNLY